MVAPQQLRQAITVVLAPLQRRIKQLVQRSVLLRAAYSGTMRLVQVRVPGGVALAGLEHIEPFGFTSHAPEGAEAIVIALGGNSSHSIVLMLGDRRYRLAVEQGEMAIYNQWHDCVHIKKDRTIAIKAKVKVLLETPLVEATQDFKVGGAFEAQGAAIFQEDVAINKNLAITGTSQAADHISGTISGDSHQHDPVTGLPI